MEEIEGLEIGDDFIRLDGVDLSQAQVTIHDVMSAGHCVRGVKRWFEQYELDFRAFLDQGIDARTFLSTRDGHAVQIVRHKMRVENRG